MSDPSEAFRDLEAHRLKQDWRRQRHLEILQKKAEKDRKNLESEEKLQKIKHRDRMIDMVVPMTKITYWVILLIIIFQVINLKMPLSWQDLYLLKWIEIPQMTESKLTIILSGFLAELLLLPKIILTCLFNDPE